MAKPQIIVNAGDPGVKAAVSASTSWTATLDSTDGVRQVEWAVTSTDETTTAASYTLVTSGSVGQTVTSTSQGQGTALILWVRVNAGKVGDQPDPENTEATVKIYVPLADGGEVGCAGEEYESDPTFGATGIINQGIRKAAALSPSGIPVKIVRAATSTALPANTRTNNILTASSNGAIGTVGGVAVVDGDHILVKDEGGVAAHVNDGPYVLADGDGSSPWTLTRATYFDASEELIPMTTFRIQEGTYAGKEFYLATSGATINVTALEFAAYAYAPNDAAYLCVGSSGFLSNEVNVSAIGTTVEFTSTSTVPFATKRTDSATAALVDVEQVTALSSGTAAAGFGPSTLYKGEVFGGGAENYGRIGFAATDLTNTSEDTKLVVQARTAGASLATCAEFSGTAVKLTALGGSGSGVVAVDNSGVLSFSAGGSGADATAKYLTDASATVNANDVPIQALSSQLAFVGTALAPIKSTHKAASSGTVVEGLRVAQQIGSGSAGAGGEGVRIALSLPNDSGTDTAAGTWRVQSTTVLGGVTANQVWATASSGTLTDRMTLSATGVLDVPAGLTAASLDASSAGALTLGGTNATSIAASSLKITGLANGTTSTDAAAFGQIGTAVNAAVSGTSGKVAKFTGTNVVGDSTITDDGTNVSASGSITAGTGGFIGVSLDRATSGTFTLGSNITTVAATSLAMTGIASIDNSAGDITCTPKSDSALVGRKDALTTTYSTSLAGRNATAATSLVTVQNGPVVSSEGTGWRTSSGGASLTVRGGFVAVPVSGAAVATRVYRVYDSGTGSYAVMDYSTDLDPYLFGSALVFGTAVFTLNGLRDAIDGNGGIRKNGSNMQLTSGGSNEVQLATNSTVRHAITSTGAITKSKNTSAVERTQHGTAGVNYEDKTGLATTVAASGTGTLYTIATVSDSYVDVEVRGFAYHVGTVGNVRAFGVRCAFKNIAGTVTDGTQENVRTPDDLGTAWGTPPAVTLASSGTNILVTGAAAGATDTRFVLTEIRWLVGTTSA